MNIDYLLIFIDDALIHMNDASEDPPVYNQRNLLSLSRLITVVSNALANRYITVNDGLPNPLSI